MFLLVPAHPGFPGQIPQSRKTVVCVCVCLIFQKLSCDRQTNLKRDYAENIHVAALCYAGGKPISQQHPVLLAVELAYRHEPAHTGVAVILQLNRCCLVAALVDSRRIAVKNVSKMTYFVSSGMLGC